MAATMSKTFEERMSQAIRDELVRSGDSQVALAKRIGVSKGTITNWIKGTVRHVYPPHLIAAAHQCAVNVIWLATGEGPKAPSRYAANNADMSLLEDTVIVVLTILEARHISLRAKGLAAVISAAYEEALEATKPPRPATVLRFVRLTE